MSPTTPAHEPTDDFGDAEKRSMGPKSAANEAAAAKFVKRNLAAGVTFDTAMQTLERKFGETRAAKMRPFVQRQWDMQTDRRSPPDEPPRPHPEVTYAKMETTGTKNVKTDDSRVTKGLIFVVLALVVSIWFVSSLVDSPDKQPDTIPTKSSAATPSRVFTQEVVEDLAAALDRGHVALEAASGNGASSGLAVDAYLINQRNTEVSLDVSLRQPLFLRNRGRGQNMFVIKVYLQGGGYLSDGFRSFISLQPKRRTPVQFIAYCADFDKDNPSATEEFVRDVSPVSLLPLLQSISNYKLSHPDQDVTIAAQTAIWLAQGVSIEEVRTKFEVNRSQELLAREFLK